jgi:hypothetical protein
MRCVQKEIELFKQYTNQQREGAEATESGFQEAF